MCFYYNLSKLAQRYAERSKANEILREKLGLVNGFDQPIMPVISDQALELMQWRKYPPWVTDNIEKNKWHILNAKCETVFDKKTFKEAIYTSRCLVLANGFFEWQHKGKEKQPYYIRLKHQDSFCFAGLFNIWTDNKTGEIIKFYTIVTTEANPLLAKIHNTKKRMPVIVTKEIEFDWLNPGLNKKDIESFFAPLDEKYIEAYPIKPFDLNKKNQRNITKSLIDDNLKLDLF